MSRLAAARHNIEIQVFQLQFLANEGLRLAVTKAGSEKRSDTPPPRHFQPLEPPAVLARAESGRATEAGYATQKTITLCDISGTSAHNNRNFLVVTSTQEAKRRTVLQVEVIKDKLILNGFKAEDLVDLSEFDSNPFTPPIAATKLLWRTLLWDYPAAQQSDLVDPGRLVSDLSDHLSWNRKDPIIIPYYLEQRPAWLTKNLSIGVYYAPSERVVLFLENDFDSPSDESLPLPTSLVIKLVCLLGRLRPIARVSDQLSVQKLLSLAQTLTDNHPLQSHIKLAVWNNRARRSMPNHFTREEYRTLLLEELGQLLELISACGLPFSTAASFAQHYETLRSPLCELLHITRSLLILIGAMPESCRHLSPLDDLLDTYVTLRKRLDHPDSPIPERVLEKLRTHTYVLSKLLPGNYREELMHCEQKLALLDSFSRTFPAGTAYPPKFHIYH